MAQSPFYRPSPPQRPVRSHDRVPVGRERNTGRRSDIRPQRASMTPCVPSQDLIRERLSASMGAGLRTERIENRCSINGRFEFQSLALARLILRKVRRFVSRKTTPYQSLTRSGLNPHSRELWRKRPERRNSGHQQIYRSAEVCARSAVLIGDFCGRASQRRMLDAERLAEGEELGSNILHLTPIRRQKTTLRISARNQAFTE